MPGSKTKTSAAKTPKGSKPSKTAKTGKNAKTTPEVDKVDAPVVTPPIMDDTVPDASGASVAASIEGGSGGDAAGTSEDDAAPTATRQSGQIRDTDGAVRKIFTFDDPVADAFSSALQAIVFHPEGNVDDPAYQDGWASDIETRVARVLGMRRPFVRVSFHDRDRNGVPFPDGNTVRVTLRAGEAVRHTVLEDPTPED